MLCQETDLLGELPDKPGWHPRQDTGSITGFGFTATGPTVLHSSQNAQCIGNNLARRMSVHLRDEADSTAVVFVVRCVKRLLRVKRLVLGHRVP